MSKNELKVFVLLYTTVQRFGVRKNKKRNECIKLVKVTVQTF